MFGTYAATAFEVEAERRREVIAESMRESRHGQRKARDQNLRITRSTTPKGRGISWFAAAFITWIALRA